MKTNVMTDDFNYTGRLEELLKGYDASKPETFDELIRFSIKRLEMLVRHQLGKEEYIHRWEQTGDVLQNATLRLYRALSEVCPKSKKEYFSLAATMIRREILDLARKYRSQKSDAAHHQTTSLNDLSNGTIRPWEGESTASPDQWLMFHEAVDQLDPDERTLFELRFYQGMDLEQAAETPNISERTARRRWRSARIALERYFKDNQDQ